MLLLAGIAGLSIACQWVAWRLRVPAILFLLLTGLAIGPGLGWLDPDALFGDLLFPIVSLSVAVILFEGSLTLNLRELKGVGDVVRRLITKGALVTLLCIAATAHFLLDLPWSLSFVLGSLTVVTGPTVIVPLLRSVRPNAAVSNVLRWEGILIDPIGALLAVVVYEYIITQAPGQELGHSLLTFVKVIGVGAIIGGLAGWVMGLLVGRHLIPEFLHNPMTLSMVFAAMAGSNALAEESGLLAVTVMGMVMANMPRVHVRDILNFKENLSVMLISGLFILLAARLDPSTMLDLGWRAVLLLVIVQFLVRPLAVLVSTVGSGLNWRERALIAWIAPRGIVAAAVSALFALRLEAAGYEAANLLVPLTFLIILGTVILQSITARPLAHVLKVSEPEPRGFLLVGANPVARAVGQALKKLGFRVLLTDSSWEAIRASRMDGLDVYFGNPVSDHADQNLDLVGIGRMLAISANRDLNVIASMRYRREFGKNKVFTLKTAAEKKGGDKHQVGQEHRGHTLFGEEVSYQKLASLLSQGWEIRITQITENFSFDNYREQLKQKIIPLFAVDPKGKLHVFSVEQQPRLGPGWKLAAMVPKAEKSDEEKRETKRQDDGSNATSNPT